MKRTAILYLLLILILSSCSVTKGTKTPESVTKNSYTKEQVLKALESQDDGSATVTLTSSMVSKGTTIDFKTQTKTLIRYSETKDSPIYLETNSTVSNTFDDSQKMIFYLQAGQVYENSAMFNGWVKYPLEMAATPLADIIGANTFRAAKEFLQAHSTTAGFQDDGKILKIIVRVPEADMTANLTQLLLSTPGIGVDLNQSRLSNVESIAYEYTFDRETLELKALRTQARFVLDAEGDLVTDTLDITSVFTERNQTNIDPLPNEAKQAPDKVFPEAQTSEPQTP